MFLWWRVLPNTGKFGAPGRQTADDEGVVFHHRHIGNLAVFHFFPVVLGAT
jgi:hypothetical protein